MRATWASWHPDRGFHRIFIDEIEGLRPDSLHSAEFQARRDAATQDYMSNVTGWKAVRVTVTLEAAE